MTLEDKVHAFRLHLFRSAQELGNVTAACRECGVSRSLYYQLRKRFVRYVPDGLHPTRRRGRPGRPTQLDATVERQIVALSLSWPTWGPRQLSDQLALRGTRVAESTVYRALRRLGLGTRKERLGLLEAHSAQRAGLLTKRTRKQLEKARPSASRRHVEAQTPGDADPEMPKGLNDRAADNWRPLLAIAEAAGGVILERAREVAVVLSGGDEDDGESIRTRLLGDIKAIFDERGMDRLSPVTG